MQCSDEVSFKFFPNGWTWGYYRDGETFDGNEWYHETLESAIDDFLQTCDIRPEVK